jgi:hypothetical protein
MSQPPAHKNTREKRQGKSRRILRVLPDPVVHRHDRRLLEHARQANAMRYVFCLLTFVPVDFGLAPRTQNQHRNHFLEKRLVV